MKKNEEIPCQAWCLLCLAASATESLEACYIYTQAITPTPTHCNYYLIQKDYHNSQVHCSSELAELLRNQSPQNHVLV